MIIGRWERPSPLETRFIGHILSVRVSGRYARLPTMTQDALAVAICHELGHFLGGFPKMLWETRDLLGERKRLWVSNERTGRLLCHGQMLSVIC